MSLHPVIFAQREAIKAVVSEIYTQLQTGLSLLIPQNNGSVYMEGNPDILGLIKIKTLIINVHLGIIELILEYVLLNVVWYHIKQNEWTFLIGH